MMGGMMDEHDSAWILGGSIPEHDSPWILNDAVDVDASSGAGRIDVTCRMDLPAIMGALFYEVFLQDSPLAGAGGGMDDGEINAAS